MYEYWTWAMITSYSYVPVPVLIDGPRCLSQSPTVIPVVDFASRTAIARLRLDLREVCFESTLSGTAVPLSLVLRKRGRKLCANHATSRSNYDNTDNKRTGWKIT